MFFPSIVNGQYVDYCTNEKLEVNKQHRDISGYLHHGLELVSQIIKLVPNKSQHHENPAMVQTHHIINMLSKLNRACIEMVTLYFYKRTPAISEFYCVIYIILE